MMNLLLVALGGAIGASARYLVVSGAARLFGPAFPWGTMLVNVAGSLAMGFLVVWLGRRIADPGPAMAFLMTGILGGFTTFSAFSLDAAGLWQRGEATLAFVYFAGSVVISIAALFAGFALARSVT